MAHTLLLLLLPVSFVFLAQATRGQRNSSVLKEFRSSMLESISLFPINRQCSILISILNQSGQTMATNHVSSLPCLPSQASSTLGQVNTSAIQHYTDLYITKLFNRLPQAYQCLILFDVSKKTLKHSVHSAMTVLNANLVVCEGSKCHSPQLNSLTCTTPRSIVRLVVRLRKRVTLNMWLTRFKNKMPDVYEKYTASRKDVAKTVKNIMSSHRNQATRAEHMTMPTSSLTSQQRRQFVVQLQGYPITDHHTVIIIFSVLARRHSGDYTTVDGKQVSAALNHMTRSQSKVVFYAEVIGSSAMSASGPRTPLRANKLSDIQIDQLRALFPRYLIKYFKSLKATNRCYILHHISQVLIQPLTTVEKSYHRLGLLQKRYFCSSQQDTVAATTQQGSSIWSKIDKLCQSSSELNMTNTVIRETRPFNAMELVMFVLLGFLCLLIIAFVANCVIFTFKTKRLTTKYEPRLVKENLEKIELTANPMNYYHENLYHCRAKSHDYHKMRHHTSLATTSSNDSSDNISGTVYEDVSAFETEEER